METTTIHKAKTQLSRFIKKACRGEEIVISRGKEPVVKLVPITQTRGDRQPGARRAKFILVPNSSNPSLRRNRMAGNSGVRLLLDTHALRWWLIKSPLLPVSTENLLRSRQNTGSVSASAWEMATKVRFG